VKRQRLELQLGVHYKLGNPTVSASPSFRNCIKTIKNIEEYLKTKEVGSGLVSIYALKPSFLAPGTGAGRDF
jgi:hypothetical protein